MRKFSNGKWAMVVSMALLILVVSLSGCIISVDGNPYDWWGILPIISDPSGELPYDVADIKEVYITHDGINLYLRFDVYGTISATAGDYWFYFDTDQNPATGFSHSDIGVDYVLDVYAGKSFLRKWIGERPWFKTTIIDLPEAWSGSVLETSVPLSALGSPTAIDLVVGSVVVDVYPEDTYVRYVVGTNFATIIVDGDPGDWGAISPAGTDATGDAPDPSMDITYCYVANDATGRIFIRMNILGLMDPALDCEGYLDTDADPYTGVLFPWGIGRDDSAFAEDVGGTVLEAASRGSYPDGTTVHLFFLATYVEKHFDSAPDVGHATYPLT